MRLYLLRHAEAVPVANSDAARELTAKGVDQAERTGKFLRKQELQLDHLLSSPLARAAQTASLVAARIGVEPAMAAWLACGMRPEDALSELVSIGTLEGVMLVGHEPDFSRLAAHLLGLPSPASIHVRKASITCLTLDAWRPGAATLEFSIPAKFL